MKRSLTILLFLLFALFAKAGDGKWTEIMNSTGKVFVVIAVMLTILAGLILYLVRLDRKISRLEKNK